MHKEIWITPDRRREMHVRRARQSGMRDGIRRVERLLDRPQHENPQRTSVGLPTGASCLQMPRNSLAGHADGVATLTGTKIPLGQRWRRHIERGKLPVEPIHLKLIGVGMISE